MANLFWILRAKFYQNRSSFVEGMTKNILAYFFIGHGVVETLFVNDSRSHAFTTSQLVTLV